jgi:predicted membrane protein
MNQKIVRILTGSLITLIGIGALLDALDVFSFWAGVQDIWPLGLIIAGLLVLISNTRQFIWASVLIFGGILLQLRTLDIIDFNIFALFWPVIIIAVGLSVLINRSSSASKKTSQKDSDSVSAVFAGSETINASKDYQGGKATAVFGGVTIDLRDAVIKKQATIDVFALCGGIELKVPRNWTVRSQVFPILGGVESKSQTVTDKNDGPVLVITGTVALGGVEVKS